MLIPWKNLALKECHPAAWCLQQEHLPSLWPSGVAVSKPSTARARFHDFAWPSGAEKPLSTLNIKLDIAGAGPMLPPWPRWQEQGFDERLLLSRGTLWSCCAQRRGLTAAAGARARRAGVREKLSQWALDSGVSPPREEEQPAKGFQKAEKAKKHCCSQLKDS